MKYKIQTILMALMTFGAIHHAAAQGTAFTYQGRLNDSGQCANGQFDLQFQLYGSAIGGTPLYASTTITTDVLVTNGLFTVTLDFGPGVFTGATYYLETDVRTNISPPPPPPGLPYTALAPRLQILAVPYAVYAGTAGAATNFSGSVGGDVQGSQGAMVVASVGGQTATNIARGVIAANSATPSNAPNSIVQRDSNGNFSAHALTLSGGLNMPDPAVFYSGSNVFLIEEGSLYLGKNGGSAVINPLDTLHNTGFGDYALNYEATTGGSGSYNTAVGENALQANSSGVDNTAVGYNALASDSTASLNTAVGYNALTADTTGRDNTAVGGGALQANTIGSINTALGGGALTANNNGNYNTAIGADALTFNLSGNYNTAIGASALQDNNGVQNTATGYQALFNNTSGGGNTADGVTALMSETSGSNNTAVGLQALYSVTTGIDNVAVGVNSLYSNTGGLNTVIGTYAAQNAINDSELVAIGYGALKNDNAANQGTSSGYGENVAVGYESLQANLTGHGNTAIGYQSLYANTNGNGNSANGNFALSANINGSGNTALGYAAMLASTTGSNEVAVGCQALENGTNLQSSTAIGYQALQNAFVKLVSQGDEGYNNLLGDQNTAVGYQALLATTYGYGNTAVGYQALGNISTGFNNIALGIGAGASLSSSDNNNICIGNAGLGGSAGSIFIGNSINTGNICIGNAGIIGNSSTIYLGSTAQNNIYIGNNGVSGDSSAIRIGNNQTTTTIAGIYGGTLPNNGTSTFVFVDAAGHLGTMVPYNPCQTINIPTAVSISAPLVENCFGPNSPGNPFIVDNAICDGNSWIDYSDRNAKSGFEPVDTAAILAKVAAMPITRWHYTNNVAIPHLGPMAQDFYAAFAVGHDDRHIGTLDESGVALAAIQGLNQKLDEREAEIAGQKDEIAGQKEEISDLKARLDRMEQMISKQK